MTFPDLRFAIAASASLAAVALSGAPAWAGTACSTDPTQCLCIPHPDDCIAVIQNAGTVVNDIFHDANGNDAAAPAGVRQALSTTGPNCTPDVIDHARAPARRTRPDPAYNCPSNYTCA